MRNLRKEALRGLVELQGFEALAQLKTQFAKAYRTLERRKTVRVDDLDKLPIAVSTSLRLFFAGYFTSSAVPLVEVPADGRPDDTSGLRLKSHPTVVPDAKQIRSYLERPRDRIRTRSPQVQPGVAGSANEVTFLFLADPQVSRAQEPHNNKNPRVEMLNNLNQVLNKIDKEKWPSGMSLDPALVNKKISKPSATFFGGDLCQTGGDYNFVDQFNLSPPWYVGGFELQMIRRLFDTSIPDGGLTKLKAGKVYFGLGNHDVQSDYHPIVGWFKGCYRYSTPSDYWRYQMWNFICQMHRGVFISCVLPFATDPVAKPKAMDAKPATSNEVFYWEDRSLSYRVELGPVDVYQLHVYGGDKELGLASNLKFLKKELKKRGKSRPVIIVQHYDFSSFSIPKWWSEKQRDALLKILEPYNVIAFLMGHDHGPLDPIPFQQDYPDSNKIADEFRPGSAGEGGNFALVRVTKNSLNIVQGSGAGKKLKWLNGYYKTW